MSQYTTARQGGETPIHSASGRIVGCVRGGVLYKSVRGSLHFLRRPPGIAFDVASLEQAQGAGAEEVVVVDRETGRVYTADIAHIRRFGVLFNRGFGSQIVLPFRLWSASGDGPPAAPAESKPQQLALFCAEAEA